MTRNQLILLTVSGAAVTLGIAFTVRVRNKNGTEDVLELDGGFIDSIEVTARRLPELPDPAKKLIAGEEGLRLTVYRDTGGAWTIGWGHLVKEGERFFPYGAVKTITKEEADDLFSLDLQAARDAIVNYVRVPLTINQRAALESLAFNIGVTAFKNSTIVKKLNAKDYIGAAAEFDRWIFDNGVKNNVLVARRNREEAIFRA